MACASILRVNPSRAILCVIPCAILCVMLCLPALAGDPEAGDPETGRAPVVVELENGCLSRCASEGRDEAICRRYCDCNLSALGRGLSEEELGRMIRLAASKERGAEQIRSWMRDTAVTCRREVYGEE